MDAFMLVSKDCFEYGSETVGTYKVPKLKREEYGVCVFPNIHGYTLRRIVIV